MGNGRRCRCRIASCDVDPNRGDQAKTGLRPQQSNAHALSSRTHEWGETLWVAKVDFRDAFGSMRIDKAWHCTRRRFGADHAAAVMSLLLGNATRPGWRVWRGQYTGMTVGERQGSVEMPRLWAATLDDALAPIPQKWQRQGQGVLLPPAWEFESPGRREAMHQADTALRFTHVVRGRSCYRRSQPRRIAKHGAGLGKSGGKGTSQNSDLTTGNLVQQDHSTGNEPG